LDHARRDEISDVVISPSWRRMAQLMVAANRDRRLGVIDLDPMCNLQMVAASETRDVSRVRWANEDLLVFGLFERGPVNEVSRGRIDRGGRCAVNHAGSGPRHRVSTRQEVDNRTAATTIRLRALAGGWTPVGPSTRAALMRWPTNRSAMPLAT
jgi:hypothetical protein